MSFILILIIIYIFIYINPKLYLNCGSICSGRTKKAEKACEQSVHIPLTSSHNRISNFGDWLKCCAPKPLFFSEACILFSINTHLGLALCGAGHGAKNLIIYAMGIH